MDQKTQTRYVFTESELESLTKTCMAYGEYLAQYTGFQNRHVRPVTYETCENAHNRINEMIENARQTLVEVA